MDELLAGLLSTPGLADREKGGVESLRGKADKAFGAVASSLEDWKAAKDRLSGALAGSLIIVGEAPYSSRGGLIPIDGASPVDPSGDMAAFIRTGDSAAFIAIARPMSILPVAFLAGLILTIMLVFLRPRLVLAAGLIMAATLATFSGLTLVESGIWWSPTIPLVAALVPGFVGLVVEALLKAASRVAPR